MSATLAKVRLFSRQDGCRAIGSWEDWSRRWVRDGWMDGGAVKRDALMLGRYVHMAIEGK